MAPHDLELSMYKSMLRSSAFTLGHPELRRKVSASRTAICMLQEWNGERNKHQAADDEVRGHAIYAVQDRHKRPALVQAVAQRHLLTFAMHLHVQHIACNE